MKIRLILVLLLVLGFCSSAYAWHDNMTAYTYRKEITIDGNDVEGSGTFSDYPVYIEITDDTDMDGANTRDDYYDIAFCQGTDGTSGTELAYERVSATEDPGDDDDGAGFSGEFWVEVATLNRGSNTTIWIYYGDSDQSSDQQDVANTWDSEYELVMHLEGSGNTHEDATGNQSSDATETGSVGQVSGQVGYAQDFSDSLDSIDLADAVYIGGSSANQDATVMMWINDNTTLKTIIGDRNTANNDYIARWLNGSNNGIGLRRSTYNYLGDGSDFDGTWQLLVITRDESGGGDWDIFVDGVESGSTSDGENWNNYIKVFTLGTGWNDTTYDYDGDIDELIITSDEKGADWIGTFYNMTSNPSGFISAWGDEEEYQTDEDTADLCSDGEDNDGDGFIDCADDDCDTLGDCEYGTELTCDDDVDNDADGDIDCADSDCDGVGDCEDPESTCNDGIDNDGDGDIDCCDSDCSADGNCASIESTDTSFPADERPTGLGDDCDYQIDSEGSDTEANNTETNADPTGATHYIDGYFRITDDGLSDGDDFRIFELRASGGTEAVYGEVSKSGSDLQLTIYEYHDGWNNTSTKTITIDTWYFLTGFYDADECDLEVYSCDNGIYSSLGFAYSEDALTNGRSADDLVYGALEPTFCNSTTTVYYDAWRWSDSSQQGALGIVKQELAASVSTTSWENDDSAIIGAEGFEGSGYGLDWDETEDGGTIDKDYTTQVSEGEQCFKVSKTTAHTERAWAGYTLPTANREHFGVSFDFYVEDGGAEVLDFFYLYEIGDQVLAMLRYDGNNDRIYVYVLEDIPAVDQIGWVSVSENTWIPIEIDYEDNGTTVVTIDGTEVSTSDTLDEQGVDLIRIGIWGGTPQDEASAFLIDNIVWKDRSVDDTDIGTLDILSDDSDSTYMQIDGDPSSYEAIDDFLIMSIEDPEQIGSPIGLRYNYKAKEYQTVHNRITATWYFGNNGTFAEFHPNWPIYLGDTFNWYYREFDQDPRLYLEYSSPQGDWDSTVSEGFAVTAYRDGVPGSRTAITGTRARVWGHDTTDDELRLGMVYRGLLQNLENGTDAHFSFYPGERLSRCSNADCSSVDSGDYATIDADIHTDDLTWSDINAALFALRPNKRPADDSCSGGAKVSEVTVRALSTNDSQEYMTHFTGSGCMSEDGFCTNGRLSGPGYVQVRFGTVEADVKSNSSGVYTTDEVDVTTATESGQYMFQVNISDGDSVYAYDETLDGSPDATLDWSSFQGQTVYYDIRVKGENASSWVSWYRLDGTSNELIQEMDNDLFSLKTFPATSTEEDVHFAFVCDRHQADRPDIWKYMMSGGDSGTTHEIPAFMIHIGDFINDTGDTDFSLFWSFSQSTGFQGARHMTLECLTETPWINLWDDHDYGWDNATKIGPGEPATGDIEYMRNYRNYDVLHDWMPRFDMGDSHVSPDYNGNALEDVEGTLDADSDANTIECDGKDLSDVRNGMVVHYTDQSTPPTHAYGIVKSVNDSTDTIELVHQSSTYGLIDKYGDAVESVSSGDSFRVKVAGLWQKFQYGAMVEFFLVDVRTKADPLYVGTDWFDGTAYLTDSKDSGTTDADGDSGDLKDAGQNFLTTVDVGDGVIVTKSGTDWYGHVEEVESDSILVLDTDIASGGNWSYTIHESGGTVYNSHEAADAAGHVQREWFDKGLEDSATRAQVLLSSVVFKHNEARTGDTAGEKDMTCFVNSDRYDASVNYYDLRELKMDVASTASLNEGYYLVGETSGAVARIDEIDDGNTLTLVTNVEIPNITTGTTTDTDTNKLIDSGADFSSPDVRGRYVDVGDAVLVFDDENNNNKLDSGETYYYTYVTSEDSDTQLGIEDDIAATGWDYAIHEDSYGMHITYSYEGMPNGEFLVDETITEYSDKELVTATGDSTTASTPPTGAEFTAEDPATYASYNRYWKGSGAREYIQAEITNPNLMYLVGDRHFHAIDQAEHSDDFYYQLDSGPCQYSATYMTGSWMVDGDDSGYTEAPGDYCIIHKNNVGDGYYTGGYSIIDVDLDTNEMIGTIYSGSTGQAFGSTEGAEQSLTITYPLSVVWIDEGFEDPAGPGDDPAGEEDWENPYAFLMMDWYADSYWIDDTVGM